MPVARYAETLVFGDSLPPPLVAVTVYSYVRPSYGMVLDRTRDAVPDTAPTAAHAPPPTRR